MSLRNIWHIVNGHRLAIFILGAAALLYSSLSLVGHYNFRTNAFDLGIFNQTVWQYSHGCLGPNTIRNVPTLLGDHFELLLFPMALLWYAFGSYTLLLIQLIAVLFGAIGVYRLADLHFDDRRLAALSTIPFLLFYGTFSALNYDFHNNVVGVMLVPWIVYFTETRHPGWAMAALAIFLAAKENLAVVGVFLGLTVALMDKSYRKLGLAMSAISLLYFIVVVQLVMPLLNGGHYAHWLYGSLGDSPISALASLVAHPGHALALLFNEPSKVQSWTYLLLAGAALVLWRPVLALLFVPVLAEKFYASGPVYWGVQEQYSVEFAPLVALALVYACARAAPRLRYLLVCTVIASNSVLLVHLPLNNGRHVSDIATSRWYTTPDLAANRADIVDGLRLIPPTASVSATSSLIPHLAGRREIYVLMRSTDYVVLNQNDDRYAPNGTAFMKDVHTQLVQAGVYELMYQRGGIEVFKAKALGNNRNQTE